METRSSAPKSVTSGSRRRAIALWLRLVRLVNSKWAVLGEQLRAWELSVAQFDIMAQVGSSQGLTQRELASRLIVTEGNITQLLDKLEQRGLVERRSEGRCNRLWLTDAGWELCKKVIPAHEAAVAKEFEALTDREQEQLSRLLRKLDVKRT